MDAGVITRNPNRLQSAGIIVRIGQKWLTAHMAAAIINIQMGGGTREPFIGVREPRLPPSHIISEGVVKGIGPYASENREGERTDVATYGQLLPA